MPDSKKEYGGGSFFRNHRRLASVNINTTDAEEGNDKAPMLSGPVEITKSMARMLVDKFTAKDTQPSKRERTLGEPVVMMEVAANTGSSNKKKLDDRVTGDFLYFWFQDEFKPKKNKDDDLDDQIPF
jgi:hypothetical protein|tara:strand:+ start:575 stop:955 length:381 start_codon:yes stop_codon:yes gene_type:complete